MLVDIVAKGGNLLLNIAPGPKDNGMMRLIVYWKILVSGWI